MLLAPRPVDRAWSGRSATMPVPDLVLPGADPAVRSRRRSARGRPGSATRPAAAMPIEGRRAGLLAAGRPRRGDPAAGCRPARPAGGGPAGWWRHGPSPRSSSPRCAAPMSPTSRISRSPGDHRGGHGEPVGSTIAAGFRPARACSSHRAARRRRGAVGGPGALADRGRLAASDGDGAVRSCGSPSRRATTSGRDGSFTTLELAADPLDAAMRRRAGRRGSSRSTTGARSGRLAVARSPAMRSGRRSTSRRRSRARSGRSCARSPARRARLHGRLSTAPAPGRGR